MRLGLTYRFLSELEAGQREEVGPHRRVALGRQCRAVFCGRAVRGMSPPTVQSVSISISGSPSRRPVKFQRCPELVPARSR